jgi:chromosome partitioning protein
MSGRQVSGNRAKDNPTIYREAAMRVGSDVSTDKVCSKCGAGYGFALCRDDECPFRYTRGGLPPPTKMAEQGGPHVIVVGNEKGGSGKSTIAMHLIVGLMKGGFSVASIDLDASQGTLSRYIENRKAFSETSEHTLGLPQHRLFRCSDAQVRSDAEQEDRANLDAMLHELACHDFIVIDTPGNAGSLSRLGLTFANTLITPLNDSFLDLDLLARIDAKGEKILTLGQYGQNVLDERHRRKMSYQGPLDWIVLRNRLTHIDARNKRQVGQLLDLLSMRLRFRSVAGFGERVIFRELFPKGLTLLDLRDEAVDTPLSMSHVAARQELRSLLNAVAPQAEQNQSSTDGDAANLEAAKGTGFWIARALTNAWRSSSTSKHRSG